MYNEGLKINFIRNYTQSINTANVATTVFTAFEPHEEAWGADLCTKSTEELQPVIDEIVGLRSKSQWMSLTILKEYVKWCITMNVPGACDGMLRITAVGLDKVRKQMVTSPLKSPPASSSRCFILDEAGRTTAKTWCPASINFFTVAAPIKLVAPVTTTCIILSSE